jgi:hypothetical protein
LDWNGQNWLFGIGEKCKPPGERANMPMRLFPFVPHKLGIFKREQWIRKTNNYNLLRIEKKHSHLIPQWFTFEHSVADHSNGRLLTRTFHLSECGRNPLRIVIQNLPKYWRIHFVSFFPQFYYIFKLAQCPFPQRCGCADCLKMRRRILSHHRH